MKAWNWTKKKTRKAGYAITQKSEAEKLVLEATSSDKWGASNTMLFRIAQLSNGISDYEAISKAMWKRISDDEIRRVQKAMILLEYLIINGSERFRSDTKMRTGYLQTLLHIHRHETGEDAALEAVIRKKAENIIALLNDDELFKSEREKAARIRGSLESCSNIDQLGASTSYSNTLYEGRHYGGQDTQANKPQTNTNSTTTTSKDDDSEYEYEYDDDDIPTPVAVQRQKSSEMFANQQQNIFDPFAQQQQQQPQRQQQNTFDPFAQQQQPQQQRVQHQQNNFDIFAQQPQQRQQQNTFDPFAQPQQPQQRSQQNSFDMFASQPQQRSQQNSFDMFAQPQQPQQRSQQNSFDMFSQPQQQPQQRSQQNSFDMFAPQSQQQQQRSQQNSFDMFSSQPQQRSQQNSFDMFSSQPQQQQMQPQQQFAMFNQPQQNYNQQNFNNQQDDLLSLNNIPQQRPQQQQNMRQQQQPKQQNNAYDFDGLVDLNLRDSGPRRDYGSANVVTRGQGQALGNMF